MCSVRKAFSENQLVRSSQWEASSQEHQTKSIQWEASGGTFRWSVKQLTFSLHSVSKEPPMNLQGASRQLYRSTAVVVEGYCNEILMKLIIEEKLVRNVSILHRSKFDCWLQRHRLNHLNCIFLTVYHTHWVLHGIFYRSKAWLEIRFLAGQLAQFGPSKL